VATSLPTELLLFAYSGHMINNTRQRKIYGLQVLATPTSLSLNNTHPWVFTYSYVPRFLPVLYALELVLIAFFPSYFCNLTLFRRISLGLRNSLPLRGMRTAVGHWIVFLFPSVSLYFPNFSVKSLGRLPERPLVCLVEGWFTILESALGTIWMDYSTPTLPFTGRQISEM